MICSDLANFPPHLPASFAHFVIQHREIKQLCAVIIFRRSARNALQPHRIMHLTHNQGQSMLPAMTHHLRLALLLTLAILLGVFTFRAAALYLTPWDDAFMFVRYADNFLNFHTISWNPPTPCYGLTSPLFLLVVLPLRLILPHNALLTATLASLLPTLLFFALLVRLVWTQIQASPLARALGLLFVLATLVHSSLAWHVWTGMETLFSLAWLTLLIELSLRLQNHPRRLTAALLTLLGALTVTVRPDLLAYAGALLGALALWGETPELRRLARWSLGFFALLLVLWLLVAQWTLGSALPLPFFVKFLKNYENFAEDVYRLRRWKHLYAFLAEMRALLLVALLVAGLALRRRLQVTATHRGLWIGSALFVLYAAKILPIMGGHERFYFPCVPALAFLAADAVAQAWDRALAPTLAQVLDRLEPRHRLLLPWMLPLLAGIWVFPLLAETTNQLHGDLPRVPPVLSFDERTEYLASGQRHWYGLARLAALPDDVVIAATEIGRPGSLAPRKKVIDMAGLQEAAFARQPFRVEKLMELYQPDWIYMPHEDYRGMVKQIETSAAFAAAYEYHQRTDLCPIASFGVALRRSSPHFAQMQEVLRATRAEQCRP